MALLTTHWCMYILGIETSCDETAVAIVEDGTKVLSNVISTSKDAFKKLGGVIPEQAARKQVECMMPVLHEAMREANVDSNSIDAIAVTKGPGLLGSLLVGTTTARVLASVWKKPLVGIHHNFGHLSSTWLKDIKGNKGNKGAKGTKENTLIPSFPILTLSVSGGHTELWYRTAHTKGTLLGRTRDDAAGEAFDKGALLLGLSYPGGPAIAKASEGGNSLACKFPLPLKGEDTLDFSFSGLKTSLKYLLRDLKFQFPISNFQTRTQNSKLPFRARGPSGPNGKTQSLHERIYSLPTTHYSLADLAASYQHALCLHLCDRLQKAFQQFPQIKEVHLVGGVSANSHLRSLLHDLQATPRARASPFGLVSTPRRAHGREGAEGKLQAIRWPAAIAYCTDNAAMIAAAACFMIQKQGKKAFKEFETSASIPLVL